jgi:glucokinase
VAVFAADLGGTRIKLGIVENGAVVERTTLLVEKTGLRAQLPKIAEAWRSLAGDRRPKAASIAFPSILDRDGRVTSDIGKYPDAMDLDLKAWALEELGLPLAIENDARMATIGEWKYGAGQGYENLVVVTLGTGIGTGVVTEGRILRGGHGQAGIMGGHLVLKYDGRPCACGNIGCAEAEASTSVLSQLAAEESGPDQPAWPSPLDYEYVFSAAEAGQEGAVRLKERSLAVWSSLVVSLVHAYDPEIVVLGGGVSRTGDWIVDSIQRYVDRHTWTPWGKPRIVRSQLGDDAALVAGEWLVKERSKDEI